MSFPKRVAIFATHPIQYQTPIWRKLAALHDLEVKVFYGTDMSVRGYKDEGFGVAVTWDTPLLEGYESCFLSTDPSIQAINFRRPNAKGLKPLLREFQPDVGLMVAYRNCFHLGAWRALRSMGVPIVMRHEATDVAHARSGAKARVRDALLRAFYAGIDHFAYIGTEARKHLRRLGVGDNRLHRAPYCVDSDFVADQVDAWLPQRAALREAMGMREGDCAFVFSGKLIDKKDPLLIAGALEHLAASGNPAASEALGRIHVIVAGDGALRAELAKRLEAVIGGRAHLLGFLNQGEMGRAYAAADALILASKRGSGETWGLVVNEAMQWGLPAFVSDGVGSAADLIEAGITGHCFQTGDAASLAKHLQDYTRLSAAERGKMREDVVRKIQGYSIDAAVGGLLEAIKSAAK